MPAISKIRFTNVIYENGGKRYNDMLFHFDGHNGAFLLENGGGKTVFIQTAIQAIIPHSDMAGRKIKDTLTLEGNPAHIAIEWILNESPRIYGVTAVSLYMENNELKSLKYVYEYKGEDEDSIEDIPFVIPLTHGKKRPASRGEISDYYIKMKNKSLNAQVFKSIQNYCKYIEENFKIIPSEWKNIAKINSGEGNVDEFFSHCKTTQQLLNNLLIPTVEEAIKGETTKDFVNTFEKQREHFKTNKRLLSEIEQFKVVKERVDEYVVKYYGLHRAKNQYENNKTQMKALNNHVTDLLRIKKEEQVFLVEKREQLSRETDALHHKEISLEIRLKEREIEELDILIRKMNGEFDSLKVQYDEVASRKQNIEISKLIKLIETSEMELKLYDKQLQEVDQNTDIAELKEQLKTNGENIRGYYIDRLEKIEKEILTVVNHLEREKDKAVQLAHDAAGLEKQEKQMIRLVSKLNGKTEFAKEKMEEILRGVLDNYEEESINDKKSLWDQRIKELAKLRQTNLERQRFIKDSLAFLNEALERNQGEKEACEHQLTRDRLQLENMEKAQKALILDIESGSHNLYISDTIYTKEESILGRLDEKRVNLRNSVEQAMADERINKRLVDIYKDRELFMADPLLEKALAHIQGEVGFVRHGVAYLVTAMELSGLSEKELFDLYPLWAISVVTTASDLPKVRKYMEKYQQDIMYPIIIVTNEEINEMIKGESKNAVFSCGDLVYPFSWKDNLVQEDYLSWKKSLIEHAKEYEEIRLKAQRDYEVINGLYQKARDFFKQYPYKDYSRLREGVKEGSKNLLDLQQQRTISNDERLKTEKEYEQLLESAGLYGEESNVLEGKITRSLEYFQMEDKYNYQKTLLEEKQHQGDNIRQELDSLKKDIRQQEDICKDLEYDRMAYERDQLVIKKEPLYKITKGCSPSFSQVDVEVLENERQGIEDKIRGLSVNRNALVEKIDKERDNLSHNQKNKALKEKAAKYPIERIEIFFDGEEIELIDKEKILSSEIEALKHKISIEDKSKTMADTLKNKLVEECSIHYPIIVEFSQQLSSVKQILVDERNRLHKKRQELGSQEASLTKEVEILERVITDIKVADGKHDFLGSHIKEDISEQNTFVNFVYEKEKTLKSYLEKLEVAKAKYVEKREEIKGEQLAYITFCQKNIMDIKLRETAINGVKKKDRYKDLLEYQSQMEAIITRSIKLAEDDRRQSDLELQTFLTHLNTYIKNVAMELDAIQKKTRIKVDDVVKQIFVFTIPDWNEYEAKEELRRYIESIVEYYDEEIEKKNLDEESLNQSIEDKLGVKNLLNVVMKDQTIKIKCRKVTNDMKINKAPMMWESSNKWSGGEKWSKNMTLFLGILNYLAEKKQYLSLNQKRQRTVILDNPFGKASSKHVLDPVFFIADKLGFQMIALTAHAEGKFIRDYFPVVYSGRLRHTVDGEKQIMTNERAINYAYLREKSPRSLSRMAEHEQLDFFE